MGLSSPSISYLSAYFMAVVDPMIKRHGMGKVYADYKNRMLRKSGRTNPARDVLRYSFEVMPKLDSQMNFCRFLIELEVDRLWFPEIHRAHGSTVKDMPVDEMGRPILNSNYLDVSPEKILLSDKRYLIDKLIIEGVPNVRIAAYCKDTLQIKGIRDQDVMAYKKFFFHLKAKTLEDKLNILVLEKESLQNSMRMLSQGNPSVEGLMPQDAGSKIATIKQNERRIADLEENIHSLNIQHADITHKQAVLEINDYEAMFADVLRRGSRRFQELDRAHDRDVVDPLLKTAKIMELAYERIVKIREFGNQGGDHGSQNVFADLYRRRIDEILDEQKESANRALMAEGDLPLGVDFNINEVGGVDKLGVNFSILDPAGEEGADIEPTTPKTTNSKKTPQNTKGTTK